jgi:phosphoribosylanthranilate isomerase
MTHTRIKFCGMTRIEDVRLAAELGVDAIGMVFVPGTPRAVDVRQAARLVAAVPPFVATVGLFLDADPAVIDAVLAEVPLDLIQFHGSESPEACASHGRPWIKALAMGGPVDLDVQLSRYAGARGVLLDAHRAGERGGRGEVFDWSLIPADVARRIVLAGGLGPHNVAAAVRTVRPWAVDVSSGIESAPGIKDPARMEAFVREVERGSRDQA